MADQSRALYRRIKPVDIGRVLDVLPSLRFVAVNIGSTNPAKSPCFVVPPAVRLPVEFVDLVEDLQLGGVTARTLLRKLGPGQGMAPHVDAYLKGEDDWRRFHVPLTSHPDIIMRWPDDGVSVHLEPGWLYEVRFDRPHEVIHGADCDRVHLQIDQIDATI